MKARRFFVIKDWSKNDATATAIRYATFLSLFA